MTEPDSLIVDYIASEFHRLYEKIAPNYGYKTRKASAVSWADLSVNNKGLMRAVVATMLKDGTITWQNDVN
jgi:hypothetical protein